MNEETILALIRTGESETVEFKTWPSSSMAGFSKELESYPQVDFHVEEIGDGFLATFRLLTIISEGVNEGVSEGVKRLLVCIRENPGLRIPELSEKLHVPAKSIERWIRNLRNEDRIVFRGAPKTGGYFVKESNPYRPL